MFGRSNCHLRFREEVCMLRERCWMEFSAQGVGCAPRACTASENDATRAAGFAYITAYLLAASSESAENAVLRAIESWDPGHAAHETLFDGALRYAVQEPEPSTAVDCHPPFLPTELRSVLRLPRPQRHCFVLRILAGWSRQACAGLLGIDAGEVDEHLCAALKGLPRLSGQYEYLA
jgi:Sigma-70, region 4